MTAPEQVPRLNDDRLCWLAVRDRLNKKADKLGPFGWLSALAGSGGTGRSSSAGARLGGDLRRQDRTDRMGDYAFAVDEAARALSAEERRHLRATGEVPDWFLGEVEQRAAVLRKQR